MADWTDYIQTKVFSKVKSDIYEELKTKYNTFFMTTDNVTVSDTTKLPTAYIYLMNSPEIAETMERKSIEAIEATFQIKITAKTNAQCKEISSETRMAFKRLGFKLSAGVGATPNKEGDLYVVNFRARRTIGNMDKL